MKSGKNTENSMKFYIIGLMFVLVGLILINVKFNILDYSFNWNWGSITDFRDR